MSWTEAEDLMESRNPKFLAARKKYDDALEETPKVNQLASQLKTVVSGSVGQVISPTALLKSLQSPTTQIPKQIASIGKLKDIPHQIEQNAWQQAAAIVDAELTMRQERVELQRILAQSELIDSEIEIAETASKTKHLEDPKLTTAITDWKNHLHSERKKWLTEVRNLFDAEYHDVKFTHDNSALPNYRNADQPDLSDWQRWCQLQRTQQLITELSKPENQKNKNPGTMLISHVSSHPDDETLNLRDTSAVRKEVRTLVQSWRELKSAQQQAAPLETLKPTINHPKDITHRQKLFKLRTSEIHHASILWELDEHCWK